MMEFEEPSEASEARQIRDRNKRQTLGICEWRNWALRGYLKLRCSKIANITTAERCWRMVIAALGLPSASTWKMESIRWRIERKKRFMLGDPWRANVGNW